MSSSKGKRASEIKMIQIDRINILNPRARNQKIFHDIAVNITQVGLKRPITVTPCRSNTQDKDYDLICGQGRLEAFMACGQKEIPAIIIDASEEQALIMSLVENLARRQHRASDLLYGIEVLRKNGYNGKTIATKTGLSHDYVNGLLNLMEKGEERLLAAVETGQMPIALAIRIAENPEDEQRALREAYESKQLRGNRLLMAKRLIDTRRRRGKTFSDESGRKRVKSDIVITSQSILKVYQREVDRKRLLTRKADVVNNRLLFITEALRQLLEEDSFKNLLRAEGLTTLPKPLAALMDEKGHLHG
jgi:ParB family transcriptional regulator, chromosome partitioning protein